MGVRLATILAISIVVVVVSSPLALAYSPVIELSVAMKRYGDSVLLDLHLSYHNTSAKPFKPPLAIETFKLEANVVTTVVKNSRLLARFSAAIDETLSSGAPFKAVDILDIVVRTHSPNSTYTRFALQGTFSVTSEQASGNATIELRGCTHLKNLKYAISVSGLITIEKKMIPEDQRKEFVNNLKLVSAMMSPAFVNAMLARGNITWIRVEELSVDVKENATHIIIPFTVYAIVDMEQYAKWLSTAKPTTVAPPPFGVIAKANPKAVLELLKKLSELRFSSESYVHMHVKIVPGYLISTRIKGNTTIYGDVEGYYRYMAKYLASILLSKLNESSIAKYLSELVILPSNATATLSVAASNEMGIGVTLDIKGLRVGHVKLTGSEAVDRVSEIISSALSGLKIACGKLGIPAAIRYSAQGVTFSPNPSIARDFAKAFEKLLRSLKPSATATAAPVTITKTLTASPPPPLTTSSIAIGPATVVKEVTVSITKFVTKTVPTTVVSRITVTKTGVSVSTTTITRTVTTTVPTTVTKRVEVTNYGLSIALLIAGLAIGGGIALALARRK